MKVVILGANGMLGSMVTQVLGAEPTLDLSITGRTKKALTFVGVNFRNVHFLDAHSCKASDLATVLEGATWAINCIGVIKPYIHEDNPQETETALRINALFPHLLAAAGERASCRIVQIATDCVYSGLKGGYVETDPHDAGDVYGKTKSLGEVSTPWMHHLRCSIIGPERQGRLSLLEWFLGQDTGAHVHGFTNHLWNGVTTLHFARICRGIITENMALPRLCHVVPKAALTKAELLSLMASVYRRTDIEIHPGPAAIAIDRTLGANQPDVNYSLWRAAGYVASPSLEQMLSELAAWSFQSEKEQA